MTKRRTPCGACSCQHFPHCYEVNCSRTTDSIFPMTFDNTMRMVPKSTGGRAMNTRISLSLLVCFLTALPAVAREEFKLTPVDPIGTSKPSRAMVPIELPPSSSSAAPKPSLLDQARKVNAMPLPLLPTASERQATEAASLDAEQQQITALWSSTLERSPDVQFVINAMQPAGDPSHARSQAIKMIGGLMFNAGMQATSTLANGPLRLGTGAAASMLNSVFHVKGKQQPDLSPVALASLYSMIRRNADRLVDAYRAYKNSLDEAVLADESVDDVRKVITARDASLSADAAVFLDMDLKRAQRAVAVCHHHISTFRKQLIDMAGESAVAQLDQQIEAEHNALARLTGTGSWRHPLQYTPPSTATQAPPTISP